MEERFKIGVISSTHGVHGEVKVFPTTDDPARYKLLKTVIMKTPREEKIVELENIKFFKNMVIVKFKGLDDTNEAVKLRGAELYVPREQAVKLKKDEYFIADLIGLKIVTDEEKQLGECVDVLETGANDVYVVRTTEEKEILIPAIKECILNIDLEENVIRVHLLDGLLDE